MERVSTAKQNSELDIALQRYSKASESHVKFDLSQVCCFVTYLAFYESKRV